MTHKGSLTGSNIILNQQIQDIYNSVCMRLIRSHHRGVLGDTYACDLRYTDGDLLIRVFGYAVAISQ